MKVWIADDYTLKNLRQVEARDVGTPQRVMVLEKEPRVYHHALEHKGEWVYLPLR